MAGRNTSRLPAELRDAVSKAWDSGATDTQLTLGIRIGHDDAIDKALSLIAESEAHQAECKAGANRAHRYFAQRLDQVRLGNRHLPAKELKQLLSVEETLGEAMEAAIGEPAVRIDAAGAIILSGRACPGADGEE